MKQYEACKFTKLIVCLNVMLNIDRQNLYHGERLSDVAYDKPSHEGCPDDDNHNRLYQQHSAFSLISIYNSIG